LANSFIDPLNNIVTLLEGAGTPVQTWLAATFGKKAGVKVSFRKRTEIGLDELPIILIISPAVEKSYLSQGARDGKHTCEFYCGFKEDDKDKAQGYLVKFEEALDDTLLSVPTETLGLKSIDPRSSENDRGMYHPVYFFAAEVEMKHRRFTP
jgi:hypothetical protein